MIFSETVCTGALLDVLDVVVLLPHAASRAAVAITKRKR
jgi:hypothetical protein